MSITDETRRESMQETFKTSVRRGQEIYSHLLHHGPKSAWELAAALSRPVYTVRPRLSELEDEGRIKTIGKRMCIETARAEAVWDVTDHQLELV